MTELEALYTLGFRYLARDKFTCAYKHKPILENSNCEIMFFQDTSCSDNQEIETRIMFLSDSFNKYVKQGECVEISETANTNFETKLLAYKTLGFKFICRDEDNTLHAYKDSVIRYICVGDSADELNKIIDDSKVRFVSRNEAECLSFFCIRPDKWRFENFYDMPKDSDFDFVTWLNSPLEI